MAEFIRNSRKQWTMRDVRTLRSLVREQTPMRVISLKLGRTVEAVRRKAASEGVSIRLVSPLLQGDRTPTGTSPSRRRTRS